MFFLQLFFSLSFLFANFVNFQYFLYFVIPFSLLDNFFFITSSLCILILLFLSLKTLFLIFLSLCFLNHFFFLFLSLLFFSLKPFFFFSSFLIFSHYSSIPTYHDISMCIQILTKSLLSIKFFNLLKIKKKLSKKKQKTDQHVCVYLFITSTNVIF